MLVLLMVGLVWSVQLDPAPDQGQVLIVPDIEYLKDRQEPVYTNGWTEELVLNRPKFQKPQPHEYLTADHIIRHLKKFDYGGAFIAPKAYIDKYQEYVGTEDGQYIIPRKEMDYLLNKANGNVEIIEKELGLKPGTFRDRNLKRVDIPFPFKFDLRMPSGNEHQALDSWVPGGVNVRGYSEAIISTVPKGEFRIHEIIYPFR